MRRIEEGGQIETDYWYIPVLYTIFAGKCFRNYLNSFQCFYLQNMLLKVYNS